MLQVARLQQRNEALQHRLAQQDTVINVRLFACFELLDSDG
jgi:hypothetical protein